MKLNIGRVQHWNIAPEEYPLDRDKSEVGSHTPPVASQALTLRHWRNNLGAAKLFIYEYGFQNKDPKTALGSALENCRTGESWKESLIDLE
jgi:hypothetical protein